VCQSDYSVTVYHSSLVVAAASVSAISIGFNVSLTVWPQFGALVLFVLVSGYVC